MSGRRSLHELGQHVQIERANSPSKPAAIATSLENKENIADAGPHTPPPAEKAEATFTTPIYAGVKPKISLLQNFDPLYGGDEEDEEIFYSPFDHNKSKPPVEYNALVEKLETLNQTYTNTDVDNFPLINVSVNLEDRERIVQNPAKLTYPVNLLDNTLSGVVFEQPRSLENTSDDSDISLQEIGLQTTQTKEDFKQINTTVDLNETFDASSSITAEDEYLLLKSVLENSTTFNKTTNSRISDVNRTADFNRTFDPETDRILNSTEIVPSTDQNGTFCEEKEQYFKVTATAVETNTNFTELKNNETANLNGTFTEPLKEQNKTKTEPLNQTLDVAEITNALDKISVSDRSEPIIEKAFIEPSFVDTLESCFAAEGNSTVKDVANEVKQSVVTENSVNNITVDTKNTDTLEGSLQFNKSVVEKPALEKSITAEVAGNNQIQLNKTQEIEVGKSEILNQLDKTEVVDLNKTHNTEVAANELNKTQDILNTTQTKEADQLNITQEVEHEDIELNKINVELNKTQNVELNKREDNVSVEINNFKLNSTQNKELNKTQDAEFNKTTEAVNHIGETQVVELNKTIEVVNQIGETKDVELNKTTDVVNQFNKTLDVELNKTTEAVNQIGETRDVGLNKTTDVVNQINKTLDVELNKTTEAVNQIAETQDIELNKPAEVVNQLDKTQDIGLNKTIEVVNQINKTQDVELNKTKEEPNKSQGLNKSTEVPVLNKPNVSLNQIVDSVELKKSDLQKSLIVELQDCPDLKRLTQSCTGDLYNRQVSLSIQEKIDQQLSSLYETEDLKPKETAESKPAGLENPVEVEVQTDNTEIHDLQVDPIVEAQNMAALEQENSNLKTQLKQLMEENVNLKLQLNQSQQTNASFQLQLRQKEEVNLKAQSEFQKKEAVLSQEIKELTEKLEVQSEPKDTDGEIQELKIQLQKMKSREDKLVNEMAAKHLEEGNFKKILEGYQNTISMHVKELEKLKVEYDIGKQHLSTLELAFSDVHQKYERSKATIAGYKSNEENLTQSLENTENELRKSAEKYESLKVHAKAQIDKSNRELALARDKFQHEITKLATNIKRLEIKNASLNTALEQKIKECTAYASLCEEITGRENT